MAIQIHSAQTGLSSVCEPILRALPSWFGIEEANQWYIDQIEQYPTFVAYENEQAVGFLTLLHHSPYASEILVMGVLPTQHRHGIGRALLKTAEQQLREQSVEFLQVKTLSEKHPDEGYKKTRQFYLAMSFRPLEEFPELWGEQNPCLQMIKSL